MDKMKEEERNWMDRLEKVKKELDLIRDFIDKQERDIEVLRGQKKRIDKEMMLVEDIIHSK